MAGDVVRTGERVGGGQRPGGKATLTLPGRYKERTCSPPFGAASEAAGAAAFGGDAIAEVWISGLGWCGIDISLEMQSTDLRDGCGCDVEDYSRRPRLLSPEYIKSANHVDESLGILLDMSTSDARLEKGLCHQAVKSVHTCSIKEQPQRQLEHRRLMCQNSSDFSPP
ncbi:hypothetical protein QR680_012042 [Steinernema hermaphroditum]|uniref:Uncharacterized protein n=1 Tax=Steinernema hermaphroditum TaxID=289476 RepID=A0AA39M032_9BILA|nr:hypothetical protein QR680_012042 [Steinernema hermaphroditum]